MTAICIIPSRGGSQRIPRKNIKLFHGKPIIAYSIETAKESGLFERIVVSTDDSEIGHVAVKYGAECWTRDPDFGRDEIGTQAVARECLEGLRYAGDHACVIYATSPLMLARDLQWGFGILTSESKPPYVFSVSVADCCIADAGQWYWGWTGQFVHCQPLVERYTRVFPIPPERVCDINEPADWTRAEQMYAALHPEAA